MTEITYSKGRFGKELPRASTQTLKNIKRGSKVHSSEDIHVNGEVTVKQNTLGIVKSRGDFALNVQFENCNHVTLCLWDMVKSPPETKQMEFWAHEYESPPEGFVYELGSNPNHEGE